MKKNSLKTNITPIVDNHTCAQCGTCLSICPNNAIHMFMHHWRGLLPRIDKKRCTECGLCLRVCPGEEIDFNGLEYDVFGTVSNDEFFSHIRRVLTGHSSNREVRYHGASGGVVTEILINLLESNEIDGALVVNMKGKEPLWPNAFIAKSREDLISAQQSKYQPVPINVGLKEIIQNKNKHYAVVGLPCHFQGLRMFEQIKPQLKKQIVVRIGLLCGFNPTLSSTKFLLKRAGVKDFNDVIDVKYRDGDWPCGFRAITRDGSDHFLYPINHFLFSHYIFERYRCAMCMDQLNELADLSIGDEWRGNLRSDIMGWSYIITRTQKGDTLIDNLVKKESLVVEKSSIQTIYSGQYATMIYKKRGTVVFGKIQQMLGRRIPSYLKGKPYFNKLEYYLGAFLIFFVPWIFEFKIIRIIFFRVSQQMLNKYRLFLIRLFRK
jgi:coenzyme F420 hydrogenase subunit beta